jgi:hypothetical protein
MFEMWARMVAEKKEPGLLPKMQKQDME